MAIAQPYLQFRLHNHPGLETDADPPVPVYVDSYPRDGDDPDTPPTLPTRGNGSTFTYNELRTPDWYLKSGGRIYEPLSDDLGVSANHFSATKRANDISTWSASFVFQEGDSRADELWAAAKNLTAFATMHVTDPGDDMDIVGDFMSCDLFGGNILRAGGATATEPELGTSISADPGPLDRGFSGPVLRRSVAKKRDQLEITIQGASWGKLLQQSVQSVSGGLSVSDRTGVAGLERLIRAILTQNAEYALPELNETDLGGDDSSGTQNWRTGLDQELLTTTGLGRVRNQIAYGGLIAVYDPSFIRIGTQNRNMTVFALEEGQHSALRAWQRLAESAGGALFDTDMQAMRWYWPRAVTRAWHPEDYVDATLNLDRPEATSWLTKHNDYRRDWLVYVIATDLVGRLGEIQVSNQSTAVRPLSYEAEPVQLPATGPDLTESARVNTLRASDEVILRAIQAQNAGLALYEFARFHASVGGYWDYPLRFGVDVGMGSPIDLHLSAGISSDEDMDIRQAAFVWANNEWSQSFGLGNKADISPKITGQEAVRMGMGG